MLMCDIAIASENALLGVPEIKLGAIPGAGGTQRLPRYTSKSNAMKMALTGEPITARVAKERGLVSDVYKSEDLIPEALKLAKLISRHSMIAASFAKRAINMAYESSLQGGLEFERSAFAGVMASKDAKEGTAAFMEKRKAKFVDE